MSTAKKPAEAQVPPPPDTPAPYEDEPVTYTFRTESPQRRSPEFTLELTDEEWDVVERFITAHNGAVARSRGNTLGRITGEEVDA